MPASKKETNGPETGSGESTPIGIGGPPTDVARMARLVATGEAPWPEHLAPTAAAELTMEVRRLRRSRLIRFIARQIAADIARDREEDS